MKNDRRTYASPPCFMHEADDAYMGWLTPDETIERLNRLLEAERAGARGVGAMGRTVASDALAALLAEVAGDEARFCGMLSRHIRRLGGRPSRATGSFYGKLIARPTVAAQLELLDRGQSWVARELQAMLPRMRDDALHADLREMLAVHERNIERCRLPGEGA